MSKFHTACYLFFGGFFFCTTPSIHAQDSTLIDTAFVPFVAYWATGDTYTFKVTKVKKSWNDIKVNKIDSTSYLSTFTVQDSTDSSYTISYRFQNAINSIPGITAEQLKSIPEFGMEEAIYKTNELGEFLYVENTEEIGERIKRGLNKLVALTKDRPKETYEKVKRFISPFMQIYGSKDGVEYTLLNELQYIHFPLGAELSSIDTFTYEDALPNPMGGEPLKANASIYFQEVDTLDYYCQFTHRMVPEQEDIFNFVKEIVSSMLPEGTDTEEALKNAELNIETENIFLYFYYPGIPYYISSLRNMDVSVDGVHTYTTEQIFIEMVDE
ncbi:MAG: hypothetical protein AAF824_14185 [Bacteroidota bacterium]